MKKLITLFALLLGLIVCSTSFAQEDIPVTYTLSLEQAIEMAYTDCPEIETAKINKQNLQKQRKDAYITQKNSKNIPAHASSSFELVYVQRGYYVNLFNKQLELSDEQLKKIRATIAYDTTQKYYNCKNALRLVGTAERALARAKDNLIIVEENFNLGMCTQLDVDNVKIAVEECEANLQNSINNLELAYDSFKIRLNIEGICEFVLNDDIEYIPFEANLESDTEKALSTRYDVKALKVTSELAKEYFDISSSLDDDSTIYFGAYTDYIQSTYNYKTGLKNIALVVKSDYYNVQNTASLVDINKKKLDHKISEFEVYKLRYDMGMITDLMLTGKSDEITAAEIAYENSLLSYKLAVEKYKYDITIGL